MAQQQKNAADLETDRGKAQTERAKALQDDDLQRDKAALDAWTKTWVAAAQFGTPVPSLTEFQQAMQSNAPRIGLLQDVPPPTSPMQPATGVQSLQQPQPGGPQQQRPQGPPMQGRPMMPNPNQPTQMPRPGSPDPATAMGVRQALQSGQLPSAYGQIANRAIAGLVAGPGGPALPRPPTPGGPVPPTMGAASPG
jgi:hypothetical protein